MLKMEKDVSQWFTMTEIFRLINESNIELYPKIIDIGAHDGYNLSNSYSLIAENGWNGILVEPNPETFKLLKDRYRDNNKVSVHNFAMSNRNGRTTLHVRDGDPTLGSFYSFEGPKLNVELRDFKTFAEYIDLSNTGILTIDTEGHDHYVIHRMLAETNIRPQMIITESWPHTEGINDIKREALYQQGYEKLTQIEENEVFLRKNR